MLNHRLFARHLEDDEHVARIVHKHWLVGLRFLALPTLSFVAAWAVLSVRHTPAVLIIVGTWAALSLIWWVRNFLDYYLDAWIVTDHGIIDLEWIGWFHRQSSRILYSDIQGVSTEICGIAATLLRYGTVSIEKISTGSTVSLSHVPRPRQVESVILKNMEAYLHTKNLKNAKHIEELLSQFVAQHINEESVRADQLPPPPAPTSHPTKKTFRTSRIGSPRA